jgi:hypothetical protein
VAHEGTPKAFEEQGMAKSARRAMANVNVRQDRPARFLLLTIIVLNTHALLVIHATMDTNFRKIDIDQFDEDVLLETELYDADPRDPAQVSEEAKARAATVRSSLSKSVNKHLPNVSRLKCRRDIL